MPEQDIYIKQIPSSDPLLGRNIEHDPRSRAYAFRGQGEPLVSVRHWSNIRTLNQTVGSCTCHTALKLCTYNGHWFTLDRLQQSLIVDDPDGMATDWYRETTRNDEFAGEWEPDDTGSSGLSASKTAVRRKYAKGFQHAFSFDDTLAMLAKHAIGIGVWWYNTFDQPDSTGLVKLTSTSRWRGGHEFVLDELDVEHEQVWAQNSWGDDFGINGRFRFSFADLERLLSEDGDSVQLTPLDEPAPEPEWDLMLAKPLRDWATQSGWARVVNPGKASRAAAASREWLQRKGL